MFGCVPPWIDPTFTVGDPSKGCDRRARSARYRVSKASTTLAMRWTAFRPRCGVAPCAATPLVRNWSQTSPLWDVTTSRRVGSPTTARSARNSGRCDSILPPTRDCGSKFCVFQPHFARLLGFELESGAPQRIRTAAGSFPAYGHEVTLTVGELEWQTTVYFAEPEDFPINVVGRIGFLDHLRVGLVDYEQLLYLGPYEAA